MRAPRGWGASGPGDCGPCARELRGGGAAESLLFAAQGSLRPAVVASCGRSVLAVELHVSRGSRLVASCASCRPGLSQVRVAALRAMAALAEREYARGAALAREPPQQQGERHAGADGQAPPPPSLGTGQSAAPTPALSVRLGGVGGSAGSR